MIWIVFIIWLVFALVCTIAEEKTHKGLFMVLLLISIVVMFYVPFMV